MPDWRELVRRRLTDGGPDAPIETDVVDELAQHLEDRFRALVARGLGDDDALARAVRELEGHDRLAHVLAMARAPIVAPPAQDVSRDGITAAVDDLRFAWRRLTHSKAFTSAAVLTLTLAVGANTAILSVADAVLFRPLPYPDPDDVYVIQMLQRQRGQRFTSTPYAVLDAIDQCCSSISDVGLIRSRSLVVETPDGAASVAIAEATANYFTILGSRPELGRVFGDNDGPGQVAVLTHSSWSQRFGRDPGIVGRSITLGGTTFDVIGVLPPDFVVPSMFAGRPELITVGVFLRGSSVDAFHPVVRVTRGVSREQAQAEVDAATTPVLPTLPDMLGSGPVLDDVRTVIYPVGRPVMRYLLAAAGLILLLACANLANMLLVRGRRNLRDTAVRLALGASRVRLIRPILFEALLIGIVSAVLAVALTWMLFDAMLRQVPAAAYGQARVGVDGRVAAMAFAMGLASALLFAIVPAWRAAGSDVLALIQPRGQANRRLRLGGPMVVVQVAIAVAVVFGAAISGRTFLSIVRGTLGFNPETVIVIDVTPAPSETNRQQFYRRIIDTLSERGDVLAAGAGALPLTTRLPDEPAEVNGEMRAGIAHVLPGYFDATAIPVISGRAFTWDDAERNPDVAVVSSGAARALFGDREPLGGTIVSGTGRQFTVIGLVGDTRRESWRGMPEVYVMPLPNRGVLSVVVRLRSRTDATLTSVRDDVRPLVGPRVVNAAWWSDRIEAMQTRRDPRFQALVFTSLGTLALGLMALGTFSVVAYLVSARTREMGVRLAVGASPHGLVTLFLRQSLLSVAIGVAGGLFLIWWGTRLIDARVMRVEADDPAMLAATVITVFCAAGLATYVPARRALRINPADVLRAE